MRDKNYYETEASWKLPAFGIAAFNVFEAASFVAKIQCLEYDTDKNVSDEEGQYSLDNPILPNLLKEEIEDYSKAILSGIEKGTLKTLYISRDIYDEIDGTQTYIDIDILHDWFAKRGIEISGDFFAEYLDKVWEIHSAATEAIVIEEYKIANKIKKDFGNPKDMMIHQLEMKIRELESKIASTAKVLSPRDELRTRERDTFLKLIIGMAVEQYGFDPKSKRNEATGNIQSDLESCGLSMDADTILKKLREASDLLPPQSEE